MLMCHAVVTVGGEAGRTGLGEGSQKAANL